MRFAHGAKSDVGRGRPANEDSFLVDDSRGLYAVADGMGGHKAGEVASATAIETLKDSFSSGRPLDEAVKEANAAVFSKASANLDMRGMGTTLTAAVIEGRSALLGHVGDSRAYLMRDGGVTRVTDDHSLVEQLVREGRLSPEEAAHHPQRAIITRALGIDAEVDVDTYRVDLRPGDRLLLASDGLTNMVDDDAIAGVLRRQPDPQRAADALVDMANEAGGDDNITVVIVDALGDATVEGAAASTALGPTTPDEPTGEWTPFPVGDEEAVDGDGAPADAAPFNAAPSDVPAEIEEPPRVRRSGRRRVLRLAAWVLPVILIVGAGFAAVGWYARGTYYVGFSGDQVTLFRGVPGGILGWDPTVEERSVLRDADLTPAQRADLEDGHRFSSRAEAERFLTRLEATQAAAAEEPATEEPASTPSTTTGNAP